MAMCPGRSGATPKRSSLQVRTSLSPLRRCTRAQPSSNSSGMLTSLVVGAMRPTALTDSVRARICKGNGAESFWSVCWRFNPHRPFRAGATRVKSWRLPGMAEVSILTGPFGPVQHTPRFDPPKKHDVSILTGPFGPVQPNEGGQIANKLSVSILTGPFGPVQRMPLNSLRPYQQFQSSPALSGRCNGRHDPRALGALRRFNPHRPFRAGATRACRRRPSGPSRFNPHRPFRAGATAR